MALYLADGSLLAEGSLLADDNILAKGFLLAKLNSPDWNKLRTKQGVI